MRIIRLNDEEAEFLYWLLEEVTMFHKMAFPKEFDEINTEAILDQLE